MLEVEIASQIIRLRDVKIANWIGIEDISRHLLSWACDSIMNTLKSIGSINPS